MLVPVPEIEFDTVGNKIELVDVLVVLDEALAVVEVPDADKSKTSISRIRGLQSLDVAISP